MPKPATASLTELESDGERVRETGMVQVRPPDLWKKHFDGGFYKRRFDGTVGDTDVNVGLATAPAGDRDEDALPIDLSQKLSARKPYVASFFALQEWDGYVLDVGSDSFKARLTDLTNREQTAGEEVEIPLSELDDDSIAQLARGRFFRWSIGYERSRSGQKTRVSRIIVRRLPSWTQEELQQAQEEAERLARGLRWE